MPLRLKSLELQGYKTFASRSLFEFSGGITAIVGPNGSGKSNIADSLRWVLGEQSYSLLRGKRTEDMIFSGSEHRARAGMAQATVLFDNSTAWLPLDFAEVGLSRYAHRDGRNEYLLNGQHIRLREMNELLSQAGLSERTYTILGQGLVDASLALKADDRRRLFEEAAGVGLYRARREDSLRRLESSERNLERVLDILSELEPRLRSLERQAKRAIEFSRAQADLKLILRDWYGFHWHRTQRDLTDVLESVKAQEARLDEARAAHERTQGEHASFRERLSGLRAQLNGWHIRSAELHRERELISRELAVLEERRRALTASNSALSLDQEHALAEIELVRARHEESAHEVARMKSDVEESQAQLAQSQRVLRSLQDDRAAYTENLDEVRAELDALHQQRAENHARLDDLRSRRELHAKKIEGTRIEIASAESAATRARQGLAAAEQTRESQARALQSAQAAVLERKSALDAIEGQRLTTVETRSAHEAAHTRTKTQLEVLDQAEQSLSGYAEGARFLLEASRDSRLRGARGALSAALTVPAELETAITAALGDTLDAVLIDSENLDDALQMLDANASGRAALLPLSDDSARPALQAPKDADCLGIAADLVESPLQFRASVQLVLGETLIARDRRAARRLIRELPKHARVVTLNGEVFRGDGFVIAGRSASSSALSRPRQKRDLVSALSALEAQISESNASVESLAAKLAEAARAHEQAELDARESRVRLSEAQESEQRAGLESESAARQLGWHQSQLSLLEAEAAESDSIQKKLVESQSSVETRAAGVQARLSEIAAKESGLSTQEAQEQVAYWATRTAVAEQSLAAANTKQRERADELARFDSRRSELDVRAHELQAAMKSLDAEKATLRSRESKLHEQIERQRSEIEPAEKDLESAEAQETQWQQTEANAQRSFANAERLFGQVQLEHTRKLEALENLRQKIVDDFGLVMFDYAADVSGPVPLPFEGMVEQLPLVTELDPKLEEQLTRHRGILRRMGPINIDAKVEFDTESARYEFLQTQMDDLHKANADLKRVVAELDELTKKEFSRTFEAVDKQFRAIFVRLFGGGSARLSLTDPKNLVETGIEIEARLPGRREQGLALLSGGERSLTAIALVFALLKVSPTPVCVMDEVDAMLDEANVGRFRDLLVDLSKDTQFIIITHNRNTVQAADVIYGITMGRDSSSQVISLRLDEVTDDLLKQA